MRGSVLLNNLNDDVRECCRHAEECALKAAAQTDPKAKQELLDLEQRWLSLARSFGFSELLAKGFKRAEHEPLPPAADHLRRIFGRRFGQPGMGGDPSHCILLGSELPEIAVRHIHTLSTWKHAAEPI